MSNIAFVAVVFLALAIQGCGGSDSSPESERSAPETPTPVVQSDTETDRPVEIGDIETSVVHRDASFIDMSPRDRQGNILDLAEDADQRLDPYLMFSIRAKMGSLDNLDYVHAKQLDSGVFWSLHDSSSPEALQKSCYNIALEILECFDLFNDADVNFLPLDNWELVIATNDGEVIRKPFKIPDTTGVEPTPDGFLVSSFLTPGFGSYDSDLAVVPLDHGSIQDNDVNNRFYVFPNSDVYRLELVITDPLIYDYGILFYDHSGNVLVGTMASAINSDTLPNPVLNQGFMYDIVPARDISMNFYPNSDKRFSVCDIGSAHIIFYNAPGLSSIDPDEYFSTHIAMSGAFSLVNPTGCVN
jgi:hypothetical protein